MSEHGVIIEDKKDNLRIRSATLKDVSILNSWWNDGSVMAHAGYPNGLNQSMEQTKECIRNVESMSCYDSVHLVIMFAIWYNDCWTSLTKEYKCY